MKNLLLVCAMATFGICAQPEQRELTQAEREMCQRLYGELGECYNEVMSQPDVVEAFQKVAGALQSVVDREENRSDFETICAMVGGELQDGTRVLPLNVPIFLQ